MRRTYIRHVSVGTVVVALAAVAATSAFAASTARGHHFGPRGFGMMGGPGFGMMGGPGFGGPGFGGPGFGGPRGGGGGILAADVLTPAADYLGLSVSDLQTDLKAGKSLADEAKAKGKTADGLVQALLAPLKTDLDKRVTAGDLTAAQESAILSRETTHLTDLVNNTNTAKTQAGLRQAGLRLALQRIVLFHR